MNIKIALLAMTLSLGTVAPVLAQQNNNSATAAIATKAQFTANITAYEQANGANSQAALNTLKDQMRAAIAHSKASLSQANAPANTEATMQARINAYNTMVQKSKANDKNGVISALQAFANTL